MPAYVIVVSVLLTCHSCCSRSLLLYSLYAQSCLLSCLRQQLPSKDTKCHNSALEHTQFLATRICHPLKHFGSSFHQAHTCHFDQQQSITLLHLAPLWVSCICPVSVIMNDSFRCLWSVSNNILLFCSNRQRGCTSSPFWRHCSCTNSLLPNACIQAYRLTGSIF